MLTPDHPNALWLAELYRPLRPEAASPELSAVELDRLRAEHVAKHMERMSPDLLIHTGGVRLSATGDMAFMQAYARRRPALSDGGDISIVAVSRILAYDTCGIFHFSSRQLSGDTSPEESRGGHESGGR